MNHSPVLAFLVGLVIACGTSGCQSTGYPQLQPPGSVQMQQRRAEFFDPFPEVESGPEIVGARPPGYAHPTPEPTRSRSFSSWLRGYGR